MVTYINFWYVTVIHISSSPKVLCRPGIYVQGNDKHWRSHDIKAFSSVIGLTHFLFCRSCRLHLTSFSSNLLCQTYDDINLNTKRKSMNESWHIIDLETHSYLVFFGDMENYAILSNNMERTCVETFFQAITHT